MLLSPNRFPRWLLFLWPFYWLAIFGSAKDFSANPVLGSPSLNAMGLHVWRRRLADRLCQSRRARIRRDLPDEWTRQWDRDGLVRLERFLDDATWRAVCSEVATAALPMVEMVQAPALTRRANLDARTCAGRYPALHRLITHPHLLGLLQYAAGYRGRPVVAVQCIHSDHQDPGGAHDPQTDWHEDTFHSTAKAWLFLHAVGPEDGPLAYVPGSHMRTARRMAWEQCQSVGAASHPSRMHAKGSFRANASDLAAMGYGEPVTQVVPANTLVVADTSGFHRRTPSPRATVRVEIYCSLRRNPFLASWYPSLLGLPVVRERWAGMLFGLYKWMVRKGLPSWAPKDVCGLNVAEKRVLHQALR
jgi:hypothetical protein